MRRAALFDVVSGCVCEKSFIGEVLSCLCFYIKLNEPCAKQGSPLNFSGGKPPNFVLLRHKTHVFEKRLLTSVQTAFLNKRYNDKYILLRKCSCLVLKLKLRFGLEALGP